MHENPLYQQGAFNLTRPIQNTPADTERVRDATTTLDMPPVVAAADADTLSLTTPLIGRPDQFPMHVTSNRAVPGEAWAEYRLEAEFRATAGLPPVSPAEFAAMTDWGDRFPTMDRVTHDETASRLHDGPEGERPCFRQETAKPTKVVIENTVFDARQERVARAMETLTHGVEGITTSEGYRHYLEAMSRFHTYSANNIALIWTSHMRQ